MIGRLSMSETMQGYLRARGPLGVPGLHVSRNIHFWPVVMTQDSAKTIAAQKLWLPPAEVMISIAVKRPEHFRETHQADLKRVA